MQSYRKQNREKILDHYGRICVCCGETEALFLTIDHVNNDGYEHRKNLNGGKQKGGNKELMRWIIRENYPDTIQILCWNCNCGRSLNSGVCPHKSGDTVIS